MPTIQAIPTSIADNPGVSTFGMIKVRSNAALEAEAQAKQQDTSVAPVITGLSSYIQKCWAEAKIAKQPIEQQMLKNMRQCNGVYDPDKLAAIRQMGGSEVYILITPTKCRAAEAWIQDVLSPVADRPWTIEPTPEAELTPDMEAELRAEVVAVFQQVVAMAGQMLNGPVPIMDIQEEIKRYTETRRDEVLEEIQEEAKRRAERMTKHIDDQLTEGKWNDAFWQVISDMVRSKAGILKGPVIRRKPVKKWGRGVNGKWEIQVSPQLVPCFDRVSPFDLYPAPDSRGVDDGYLIERHHLTRNDLIEMIGVPGYSEQAIRDALDSYGDNGLKTWLPPDTERAQIEFGTSNAMVYGDKIEVLEFWGPVRGRLLREWGLDDPTIDPSLDYDVNVWQVGSYTIRALLNPDKLGRKPYSVDSFERVAGSFWGKGIPEMISDVQDVCNAVARAIVNNAALASGPQVEVNTDRMRGENGEIYPWKIWESTNQQMMEAPAVRFNQPQVVVAPLLQVYEFFSTLADDQSGVPRWAYGQTQVGGAGGTSSGLSMLMTSASRGVKMSVGHVDCMVASTISRTYDYNMQYSPDESIKGDCNIVAKGSSSLMAKEQHIIRRTEFLNATANPIDIQILGLQNRAKLLVEQARELNMAIDYDDDLEKKVEAFAAQVQAQAQQQMLAQSQGSADSPAIGRAPTAAPRMLDNAGNPAGGTDVNTSIQA